MRGLYRPASGKSGGVDSDCQPLGRYKELGSSRAANPLGAPGECCSVRFRDRSRLILHSRDPCNDARVGLVSGIDVVLSARMTAFCTAIP